MVNWNGLILDIFYFGGLVVSKGLIFGLLADLVLSNHRV